ncbi:hypothetical protein BDV98DRAFT_268106 [Pterulicium gracile]|uniref:Uncharacterized protein n=1 Tax=Pterulicium gracile TaxID=1884261 RepID=A0A5C3Q7S6_9AGAR|nr:hypothetical protein BDV98DRAFT_268106 [Pterula gracilis]
MHGSVHVIMGGDLAGSCPSSALPGCAPGPTFSANELMVPASSRSTPHSSLAQYQLLIPLQMIDKIWSDWQQKHPSNKWSSTGGSIQADFFNSTDMELFPNGKPPLLNLKTPVPADGRFREVTNGDVMDTTEGYLCYVYV